MKKHINGKTYDTDTARKLATWRANETDWMHAVREELYLKRTGEYFLYGEGGPSSRYSRCLEDNSWASGEAIIPLSLGKAKAWAEEHLDADEYEAIFGLPDENAEGVTLSVTIPARLMAKLRQSAAERQITLTDYVVETLSK